MQVEWKRTDENSYVFDMDGVKGTLKWVGLRLWEWEVVGPNGSTCGIQEGLTCAVNRANDEICALLEEGRESEVPFINRWTQNGETFEFNEGGFSGVIFFGNGFWRWKITTPDGETFNGFGSMVSVVLDANAKLRKVFPKGGK
jgi:hypothetical protein